MQATAVVCDNNATLTNEHLAGRRLQVIAVLCRHPRKKFTLLAQQPPVNAVSIGRYRDDTFAALRRESASYFDISDLNRLVR